MPSIEIVCVLQKIPMDFGNLPFAVEGSSELRSHRRPAPLFQRDFDRLSGCIYHLGNPELKDPTRGGLFFGYELLSPACRDREPPLFLEFEPAFEPAVRQLLERLLQASPAKRLFFTSDWQFGPRRVTRDGEVTLPEFWQWHARHRLRLNGWYTIVETANQRVERSGARGRRRSVPSRAGRSAAGR